MWNQNCPTHALPWKTIPAGVSKKTGKPYQAFKVCPDKDCKQKPQDAFYPQPGSIHNPTPQTPSTEHSGASTAGLEALVVELLKEVKSTKAMVASLVNAGTKPSEEIKW